MDALTDLAVFLVCVAALAYAVHLIKGYEQQWPRELAELFKEKEL